MAVGDTFEILGYFFFFWLYVLSPSYRKETHQTWKKSSYLDRFFMGIEAVSSLCLGLILPIVAIYFVVS